MNPYLAFGLAMCAITILALAGTSYLAMYFNRRAKNDLEAALIPLADVVNGTYDLDEATLEGRYEGHLAQAVVELRPGGMGRVFHVRVFDGAGGVYWLWTLTRSKDPGESPTGGFQGAEDFIDDGLRDVLKPLEQMPGLDETWFRVEYDPEAGHVQLMRPMQSRRDIPDAEMFTQFLIALKTIADRNRLVQGPAVDSSGTDSELLEANGNE